MSLKKESSSLRKKDFFDFSVGQHSLDYEYQYYEKDTFAKQSLQGYQADVVWGKSLNYSITSLSKIHLLSLSDKFYFRFSRVSFHSVQPELQETSR